MYLKPKIELVDSSIRPAILNESDLFLSDDAVEQIVDQVQRIQMKCYFQFISFSLFGPHMSRL